jgi:HEAT repeat protein
MIAVLSWIQHHGPGGVVVEAILLTIAVIMLLLAFILTRRGWRSRLFRRRDERLLAIRAVWTDIVDGTIPASRWRDDRLSCDLIESMLLDRLECAESQDAAPLLRCLRESGLVDLRIQDARRRRGYRKRHALASLGRMRAAEGVPALAEALDDRNRLNVLLAIRGLGRLGLPDAAVPILERFTSGAFATLPVVPIQNALLSCCRRRPALLVPYIHRAGPDVRPHLSRVLGEVANGALDEDDLILLATDPQSEVRASAARALACAPINVAIPALATLTEDDEWFVRLRAVVALGQLVHPHAIPVLIQTLCDRNRFVRLRAAAGLAKLDAHLDEILALAEKQQDLYAMQALLSELQVSGVILAQVDHLTDRGEERIRAERILLQVLDLGAQRLLVSALGAHRSRKTRFALARLLARARVDGLVPLLTDARAAERAPRRRAILDWVIEQIAAGKPAAPKRRTTPRPSPTSAR